MYPQPPELPLLLLNLNFFSASIAFCLRVRFVVVSGFLSGAYLILEGITFPCASTQTFSRTTPFSCTPPFGCETAAMENPPIPPVIPGPIAGPSPVPSPAVPIPPVPDAGPSDPSGRPL